MTFSPLRTGYVLSLASKRLGPIFSARAGESGSLGFLKSSVPPPIRRTSACTTAASASSSCTKPWQELQAEQAEPEGKRSPSW